MSPIDQAFLKAFASVGRPSVAAASSTSEAANPPADRLPPSEPRALSGPHSRSAPSSQRPINAPIANAPKPTTSPASRQCQAGPAAAPAARQASNTPAVSSPRITLSEAIALRQAQRAAVEPKPQGEPIAPPIGYEAEAVEHHPTAVEPPIAYRTPSMPAAMATATAIDTSPTETAAIEEATTIAIESASDDRTLASRAGGESVAEATAARLAQLTARWEATVAESEAGVADPPATESSIPVQDAERHTRCEPVVEGQCPSESAITESLEEAAGADEESARAANAIAGDSPAAGAAQAVSRDDATEAAPILRLLRPAIQLERFAWPSLVSRWMRGCGEQLDGVVDALLRAARKEQRIIGFSSYRPGEGVSSVVLAAARRLSQRRCRFVVLEANWNAPQLARRLALLSTDGWEAAIEGRRDLADVMVGADEGRAAVVPAMRAPDGKADPPRIAETYDLLRQNYEIILVDLPPRGCGLPCLGTLCDAVVLVQHPRQTRSRELQQYAEQWSSEGVGVLGVVQNGLN